MGPDGEYHVYVKQGDLPTPEHLADNRFLPAHSRVCPPERVLRRLLKDSFQNFLMKIASPYSRSPLDPSLPDDLANSLLLATSKYRDEQKSLYEGWDYVDYIKRRYEDRFYIEALDKDTAQFVLMCPKLMMHLTHQTLQFQPWSQIIEGLSYVTTGPFSATCILTWTKITVEVPSGSTLAIQSIVGDLVEFTFQEYRLCSYLSQIDGLLSRKQGEHFAYENEQVTFSNWPDLRNIRIPDLSDSLQPNAINLRYSRTLKRMLEGRKAFFPLLKCLPKVKSP